MALRASGSTFYNPQDPHNPVTHEARCCFLKIVLDNEPELSQRYAREVQPLFCGLLAEEYRSHHISDLALWAGVYAHADRLEQKHPQEALARRELAIAQAEQIYFYLPFEKHEKGRRARSQRLDASQVLPVLASFYNETCLRYLGSWGLEIFLQLAIYCNTYGAIVKVDEQALLSGEPLKIFLEKPSAAESIDHWGYEPAGALIAHFGEGFTSVRPWQFETCDHPLILELLTPKNLSKMVSPPEDEELICRTLELSYRQYIHRYFSREGYRDKPMVSPPPWFYDEEADEYLAYFESIERESLAQAKVRLSKARAEIEQHFQKRREKWARECGLVSFQGKRSRVSKPKDQYYWLYLYIVKGWDAEEIRREAVEIADKEVRAPPGLEDVKKALTATAELVQVDIQDFKKRKKWAEARRWIDNL